MPRITPFLWFNGDAETAAKFYVSVFKRNSKIKVISRYGESGPGKPGSVMTVLFQLDGQEFVALNGGRDFKFTEAVSFVVNCATQKEIDWYWKKLSAGGKEIQCGWLKDRFGLCWQITPANIAKLIASGDRARTERVMQAVFGMVKLDIAALEAAYAGRTGKAVAKSASMAKKKPA
jgi:predicted 3-demethylubiquinone-9 3-methyltransferase (glyoxalase superfamily)